MSLLVLNGVPVSHDGSRGFAAPLGNGKPTMVGGVGRGSKQGRGGGGREGLAVVESAGLDTDSSCLRFVWRCGVELGTLGVFSLARAGGGQPAGPFATGRRSTGENAH